MRYIDEHKEFGVEPICQELQIAPSTYYARKSRSVSKMAKRHEEMKPKIEKTFDQDNYRVYGVHKIWKQMNRQGDAIGRDQVGRLMGELGIEGIRRGKTSADHQADPTAVRPPDLVDRDFSATRPDQLWVTDFTYVPTWSGFAYAAFVIDVFSRMIVGWRVATSMTTDLVLDTLEMALWRRDERVAGVICHSDAGQSNTPPSATPSGWRRSTPLRPSEVEATATTTPWPNRSSVSTRRSSSVREGPGGTPRRWKMATLPYVDRFNTTRLHTEIGDVPPAELEATYYRRTAATEAA